MLKIETIFRQSGLKKPRDIKLVLKIKFQFINFYFRKIYIKIIQGLCSKLFKFSLTFLN